MGGLSETEIASCLDAFLKFDQDGSGTIDKWELERVLNAMGQTPTQGEIHDMIAMVDEDNSGEIDFSEFLSVFESQKRGSADDDDAKAETLEAFVALGGNSDETGYVTRDRLSFVVSKFGLTIDLEKFFNEVDTDGSGTIEYEEFVELFKNE